MSSFGTMMSRGQDQKKNPEANKLFRKELEKAVANPEGQSLGELHGINIEDLKLVPRRLRE